MKRVNYKESAITAKENEINVMDQATVLAKIKFAKNFIKAKSKSVNDNELLETPDQEIMCTMKQFLASEKLTITAAIKKMQNSLKYNKKVLCLPEELNQLKAVERNRKLIERLNNSCKSDQAIMVLTKEQKVYAFNMSGQMLICFNKDKTEKWNIDKNGDLKNKEISQMFQRTSEVDAEENIQFMYKKYVAPVRHLPMVIAK